MAVLCLFFGCLPLRAQVPPTPPKTDLERAELHLKAGQFPQAEKLLSDMLARQANRPDAPRCYLLLGNAQEKQNSIDEAIRTYVGLVTRFPGTEWAAQAIERQSVIYLQRKNPTAAQKLHDSLLEHYPNSPTTALVWTSVADAYFEKQEYAKAAGIYQKIEQNLSPSSSLRLDTARVLATGGGDPRIILPIAEKALAEDNITLATALFEYLVESQKTGTDLPRIKTKLGWCLYLDGDQEKRERAEQLWAEVIRSTQPADPWYAEARWHQVQLAAGPKNDLKEAISICNKIVSEQKVGSFPHEQALFAKAWLLTAHDKGKAAVAAFDDLAAAYPEKMKQPAIQGHLRDAQKIAAKESGGKQ